MFPHPCGDEFERAVAAGADPKLVVPDDYVVLRGGTKPVPVGEEFSCVVGPTTEAAGCAIPNNQGRITTAGVIRAAGGTVEWLPEMSPRGNMNKQHVHVMEVGSTTFGDPIPNPTPKATRIDAT